MQHGKGSAWTKVKIYSFQRAQNFPIIQTPDCPRRAADIIDFHFLCDRLSADGFYGLF